MTCSRFAEISLTVVEGFDFLLKKGGGATETCKASLFLRARGFAFPAETSLNSVVTLVVNRLEDEPKAGVDD